MRRPRHECRRNTIAAPDNNTWTREVARLVTREVPFGRDPMHTDEIEVDPDRLEAWSRPFDA